MTTPDTKPIWTDAATAPRYGALQGDATFDVVVIGAGITGLTAALLLKRAGKRVAVVERHRLGEGDTGHTSAT